jgi:hypothetical protein
MEYNAVSLRFCQEAELTEAELDKAENRLTVILLFWYNSKAIKEA